MNEQTRKKDGKRHISRERENICVYIYLRERKRERESAAIAKWG